MPVLRSLASGPDIRNDGSGNDALTRIGGDGEAARAEGGHFDAVADAGRCGQGDRGAAGTGDDIGGVGQRELGGCADLPRVKPAATAAAVPNCPLLSMTTGKASFTAGVTPRMPATKARVWPLPMRVVVASAATAVLPMAMLPLSGAPLGLVKKP